jgi:hypothetical protein
MNTKNNFKRSITSLVVAVPILLCILYVLASAQPAQKTTAPPLKHLETLSEDLIDFAANKNSDAVMNALKALKEGVSSLGSAQEIGAEKTKELLNRIMKMEELWHTKKVDKFIIDDNRLFLEFVDLLYKSGPQDTPRVVVYLDYLARELQYRPRIKDWKATERAIKEIENNWRYLSREIKTKALSSLFETTIARLPEVLRKRDGEQLYFIGQLILDEVDLLENYFKKPF